MDVAVNVQAVSVSALTSFLSHCFDWPACRGIRIFNTTLGLRLMMQRALKHRYGSLIELKPTLFYRLQEPNLSPLHLEDFKFRASVGPVERLMRRHLAIDLLKSCYVLLR